MFATYVMGLSLMVGQALTPNCLNYKLEQKPITYEPPEEGMVQVVNEVIEPSEERTEEVSFSLENADPSMYYKDGLYVMVYDNEVLTALGVSEASFDEVRYTLEQNQNISPEYKVYMNQFLDLLEVKMPEVDLRVLNSNWKDLEYVFDLDKDSSINGTWNSTDKKLHLKEEYIDSQTGKFDEKEFITCLVHELVHTLNYGVLTVTDPNTKEELQLRKFFQRTNYGESFSEGLTTIITDYLLSDYTSIDDYLQQENPSFDSYQVTAPICYQVYKGMDNYDLYDFINKDISYFDTKVKETGFEDTVLIVDAYYETLDELYGGHIVSTEELDQLLEDVIEKRIQDEIKNNTSNFKILSFINDISREIAFNHINQFKVAKVLEGRDDGIIYLLTDQEKMAGLTEEEQEQKGFATVRIDLGENKEPMNISPRSVLVYPKEVNSITEYHLAYFASDQEYHDVQTDEIVQLQFENSLGLFQVLPEMDILIRDNLLKDPDFIKEVDQKLEEKRKELKESQERCAQREKEKEELRSKLDPLINEAMSIGAGDLELCRIVSENSESLTLGMEILHEYKPESLIIFRNPLSKTEDMTITTLSVIHSDGTWHNDNEVDSYIIYQIEEEEEISYHLGKLVEENGESHLYDDRGNLITNPVNLENTYAFKEVLPEIGTYTIQVKEEFFSSLEFQNIMNVIQTEKSL